MEGTITLKAVCAQFHIHNGCRASRQEFPLPPNCTSLKVLFSFLGQGQGLGSTCLYCLKSISMHSRGMGSASLQRQQTVLHLAVVLHPALAFELCDVSQTLLLESLCADALWPPLVQTKERSTSLNCYNPLSLMWRPKSTTLKPLSTQDRRDETAIPVLA